MGLHGSQHVKPLWMRLFPLRLLTHTPSAAGWNLRLGLESEKEFFPSSMKNLMEFSFFFTLSSQLLEAVSEQTVRRQPF